ncbi:MAG: helix-turn-helix domain-containing protein [Ornithinimicrobium sp.]
MSAVDDHSSGAGRRGEVLQALKAAPEPQSIIDLAEQLGVHANTVRFHLTRLLAAGQVERVDSIPRAPGRPPQLFGPMPGMDPAGPRSYRMLAEVLVAALADGPDPRAKALQIGRTWGRQQAQTRHDSRDASAADAESPVDALVSLLDEIGFAPEVDDTDDVAPIRLRHCPFLELTYTQSKVVCSMHLGLMQGALQVWGGPVQVGGLDAFVEPDLCLAHLSTTGAS